MGSSTRLGRSAFKVRFGKLWYVWFRNVKLGKMWVVKITLVAYLQLYTF